MAVASTDPKASSPEEAADPLKGAVRAAAVHSAALVLVNAAQHVQRTTLLVETATARAMARIDGEGARDSDQGLAIARAALAEAMSLFEAAQAQARALGAADPGETTSP